MSQEPTKPIRRPRPWAAPLTALALLVVSGIAYRVVAARVPGLFAIPPLPKGLLAQLPAQIGAWTGEDVPFDERVLEVLHADDYINRAYRRRGDREAATLSIVLHRRDVAYGVPYAELMPHRPEKCYPRVGWTHESTKTVEIATADGTTMPVEIFRFTRGEIETECITILTYYILDGVVRPTSSALRSQGWLPKGDVRYVAQVQVACRGNAYDTAAEDIVRAFTADAADVIMTRVVGTIDHGDPPDARSGG